MYERLEVFFLYKRKSERAIHMKICSNSVINKEMQIKTMWYLLFYIQQMGRKMNWGNIKYWQECRAFSSTVGEVSIDTTLGNSFALLKKVENAQALWLFGIFPWDILVHVYHEVCTWMFITIFKKNIFYE